MEHPLLNASLEISGPIDPNLSNAVEPGDLTPEEPIEIHDLGTPAQTDTMAVLAAMLGSLTTKMDAQSAKIDAQSDAQSNLIVHTTSLLDSRVTALSANLDGRLSGMEFELREAQLRTSALHDDTIKHSHEIVDLQTALSSQTSDNRRATDNLTTQIQVLSRQIDAKFSSMDSEISQLRGHQPADSRPQGIRGQNYSLPEFLGERIVSISTPSLPPPQQTPFLALSSPLDAQAAAFSPQIAPPRVDPYGNRHPIVKPSPYNGDIPFETYLTQFDMLTSLYNYDAKTKSIVLATCLQGAALTVLENLTPLQRTDYPTLTTALNNRFGVSKQVELAKVHLRSRRRRTDEPLTALASEIERLVRLAYPAVPPDTRDELALDKFIDSLDDLDLKLKTRESNPTSLTAALDRAQQLEAFKLANASEMPTQKTVRFLHSPAKRYQSPQRNWQAKSYGQTSYAPPNPAINPFISYQRLCYACSSPDHLIANCPNRAQRSRSRYDKDEGRKQNSERTEERNCFGPTDRPLSEN